VSLPPWGHLSASSSSSFSRSWPSRSLLGGIRCRPDSSLPCPARRALLISSHARAAPLPNSNHKPSPSSSSSNRRNLAAAAQARE
jgi:hypothetical protein